MPLIRVDPPMLRQSAQQLNELAAELRGLGDQVSQAADEAPSYDGQFGPKVRALAEEGRARLHAQAAHLGSLSDELLARAEAFEAADLETQTAFQRLASSFQDWFQDAGFLAPFARLAGVVGLGNLISPSGGRGAGEPETPPWWVPVLLGISRGWFDLDERVLSPLRETLVQLPQTWSQNLEYVRVLAAFYSSQTQDWIDEHVGQPIEELLAKLPALQEPGLPSDGPLTPALLGLSMVDGQGNPLSPVGYELVQLIDARGGVTVIFADELSAGGTAGVSPFRGMVWLPERYREALMQEIDPVLVGHELAHVLQRDLPEFPDGTPTLIPFSLTTGSWPYGPSGLQPFSLQHGAPLIGDFTLYMEVQSNIIDKAIHYDLLSAELAGLSPGTPEYTQVSTQMTELANRLATYTGDAKTASVFVVQDHGAYGMYTGELVREAILGARVPEGGWQHWLAQQGFSESAIEHIQGISSGGVPQQVHLAEILDRPAPLFPTVDMTPPTPTPDPTLAPSPVPTPGPTVTPEPTSTPAPPRDTRPD